MRYQGLTETKKREGLNPPACLPLLVLLGDRPGLARFDKLRRTPDAKGGDFFKGDSKLIVVSENFLYGFDGCNDFVHGFTVRGLPPFFPFSREEAVFRSDFTRPRAAAANEMAEREILLSGFGVATAAGCLEL